jgi:DNA-binding NarL/FixJ family response regulator
MPLTKVLIVDDHPLFSKGLVSLIISQPMYIIVGEARDSAGALDLLRQKKPDLAIVDLNLGNEDGLELIKVMKDEAPRVQILVLSMHDERFYTERALQAGARGYIMKAEAGNNVIDAIKTVMAGKVYISDAERERLFGPPGDTGKESGEPFPLTDVQVGELSNRQLQIFSLIGKGLGSAEIAAKLNLSVKTVAAHKEYIKSKLHRLSSRDLSQLAIEWAKHEEQVSPFK